MIERRLAGAVGTRNRDDDGPLIELTDVHDSLGRLELATDEAPPCSRAILINAN